MKQILILIAFCLFSFVSSAQTQSDTAATKVLEYLIQFNAKDTVHNKEYVVVAAHTKPSEYVFYYSPDWGVDKALVNRKFASWNPVFFNYKMISEGTWQFEVAGVMDPNEMVRDFASIIMNDYLNKMQQTLNKK